MGRRSTLYQYRLVSRHALFASCSSVQVMIALHRRDESSPVCHHHTLFSAQDKLFPTFACNFRIKRLRKGQGDKGCWLFDRWIVPVQKRRKKQGRASHWGVRVIITIKSEIQVTACSWLVPSPHLQWAPVFALLDEQVKLKLYPEPRQYWTRNTAGLAIIHYYQGLAVGLVLHHILQVLIHADRAWCTMFPKCTRLFVFGKTKPQRAT